MISQVKDDVINRLIQKRGSDQHTTHKSLEPYPRADLEQVQTARKQNQFKLKKEIEVLDMLERLEKQHPKALDYFIEQARKKGLYDSRLSNKGKVQVKGTLTPNTYGSGMKRFGFSKFDSQVNLSTNSSNTGRGKSTQWQKSPSIWLEQEKSETTPHSPVKVNLNKSEFMKEDIPGGITQSVERTKTIGKSMFNKMKQSQGNLIETMNSLYPRINIQSDEIDFVKDLQLNAKLNQMKLTHVNSVQYTPLVGVSQQYIPARQVSLLSLDELSVKTAQGEQQQQANSQANQQKVQPRQSSILKRGSGNRGQDPLVNKIQSQFLGLKSQKKADPLRSSSNLLLNIEENVSYNKRNQLFTKLPKLATLLEDKKPFYEFFKRICNPNVPNFTAPPQNSFQPVQRSSKEAQQAISNQTLKYFNNTLISPPKMDKEISNPTQSSPPFNQYLLKNLRLQKINIKLHLAKRYGKPLSEKIISIIESYNKSMHNIDHSDYLALLSHTIMSNQPHPTGQGLTIPNCFKFFFQVLDFGNKGFICEHDLFQLIYAIVYEKTFGQTNLGSGPGSLGACDQEPINISINYKDSIPQPKRNVFQEIFKTDFANLIREIEKQQKNMSQNQIPNLVHQSSITKGNKKIVSPFLKNLKYEDDDNLSLNSQVIKPNKTVKQKKQSSMKNTPNHSPRISKRKPITKLIADNIEEHTKDSLLVSETTASSHHHQQKSQGFQIGSQNGYQLPIINAFSHFNQFSQGSKLRKGGGSTSEIRTRNQQCKQITFEQFVRMSFQDEIPAFVEDFFQYMTTLSLRELVSTYSNLPGSGNANSDKQNQNQKNNNRKSNVPRKQATILQKEDKKLMFRQILIQRAQNMFQKDHFQKLCATFKLLSQNVNEVLKNGNGEDLINQMYLTQGSIQQNFGRLFGMQNDSLALRLYNLFSDGINMKRIYLPKYLATLYPLIQGSPIEQNYFIFKLLDGDNDDRIEVIDLADIFSNILQCPISSSALSIPPKPDMNQKKLLNLCQCPLYQEIYGLYIDYVRRNIISFSVKPVVIDFSYFVRKVKFSCLVKEFKARFLMDTRRVSVFSHNIADIRENCEKHDDDIIKVIEQQNVMSSRILARSIQDAGKLRQKMYESILNPFSGYTQETIQEVGLQELEELQYQDSVKQDSK